MRLSRFHKATVDSTNEWAKRDASRLAVDRMHLYTADEQSAGKGRAGRHWLSPESNNLYASFAWWESEPATYVANVGQVLGLCACELMREHGCPARLKWPNDILANEKKLAGILCETQIHGPRTLLVAGIGINIGASEVDLEVLDRPASSLTKETGKSHDADAIALLLAERFLSSLLELRTQGFACFHEQYRQKLWRPNGQVRFTDGSQEWEGLFVDVHSDGSLELDIAGTRRRFHAGEFVS